MLKCKMLPYCIFYELLILLHLFKLYFGKQTVSAFTLHILLCFLTNSIQSIQFVYICLPSLFLLHFLPPQTSSISIVNATLSDSATYYCGLVQDADVSEYQGSTVQVGCEYKMHFLRIY